MTDAERAKFDALMDDAVGSLPRKVAELLEEIAVVVLDEPTAEMLRDLGIEGDEEAIDEMCGLHTGTALTERSVEAGELPTTIHLFRRGIVALALGGAGGWDEPKAEESVYEEIRITLLHEIGHHFGLDEGDLESLGYD